MSFLHRLFLIYYQLTKETFRLTAPLYTWGEENEKRSTVSEVGESLETNLL